MIRRGLNFSKADLFSSVSFSLLPCTSALWWPSFLGTLVEELQEPVCKLGGLLVVDWTGLNVNRGGLQSALGGLQPSLGGLLPVLVGLLPLLGELQSGWEGLKLDCTGLLEERNRETFMREPCTEETLSKKTSRLPVRYLSQICQDGLTYSLQSEIDLHPCWLQSVSKISLFTIQQTDGLTLTTCCSQPECNLSLFSSSVVSTSDASVRPFILRLPPVESKTSRLSSATWNCQINNSASGTYTIYLSFPSVNEFQNRVDISYSDAIQEDERMVMSVLPKNLLEQFTCSRENQFVCWYLTILTGQSDIKEVPWCSNLKGDMARQHCISSLSDRVVASSLDL